jgi:hypothetical protein
MQEQKLIINGNEVIANVTQGFLDEIKKVN